MITSAWGFLSRDRTRAHYRDRKHSGEREQYGFCLVSLPPPHWYFSRTQLQINCVSIAPRTLIRLRRQIIDGLFSCDRVVPGRFFLTLEARCQIAGVCSCQIRACWHSVIDTTSRVKGTQGYILYGPDFRLIQNTHSRSNQFVRCLGELKVWHNFWGDFSCLRQM